MLQWPQQHNSPGQVVSNERPQEYSSPGQVVSSERPQQHSSPGQVMSSERPLTMGYDRPIKHPSQTITIPMYIFYDNLKDVEDEDVWNFWSAGPKFLRYQEFGLKAVLEELNTAIHAWPCQAEYGKQLSSCARIMELFEMLETGGKTVAIPEVAWDRGLVRIGDVWRYYR
jgi:hypothetical protein